MANPNYYEPQERPSVVPGAPSAPLLDSGAKVFGNIAGTAQKAAGLIAEDDNQQALMQAHTAVATDLETVASHLNEMKTDPKWGDNPNGFTPEFHKYIDDIGTKSLANITNPRAKMFYAESFGRLGLTQVREADNWERGEKIRAEAKQLYDQGQAAAKVVAASPALFEPMLETLKSAVDTARLMPEQRITLKQAAEKTLTAAAMQSHIENNPQDAFDVLSKALGLSNTKPSLPPTSLSPGSSAPVLNTPMADATERDLRIASLQQFVDKRPTGVDPELARAIESPEAARAYLNGIQNTPTKGKERRTPLEILQAEAAAQKKNFANSQSDLEYMKAGGEITPGGVRMGINFPPSVPTQVASSGETATDAGSNVLPLSPITVTGTPEKTGNPYVDKMTTQELVQYRNEAHARMLNGQTGARAELSRQMHNAETAAKDGFDVPPIERSLFSAAHIGDEPSAEADYKVYQAWQNFATDVRAIRPLTNNGIDDYLKKIEPKNSSASDFGVQRGRYDATVAAANHVKAARAQDVQAALAQQGVWASKPLNFGNAAALEEEIHNRQQASASMQGTFLYEPVIFSKPEAAALATIMQNAPRNEQTSMLALLSRAADDPAHYRALIQQIHPDNPGFAVAGRLASFKPGYELDKGFPTIPAAVGMMIDGGMIAHPSDRQKKIDGVGAIPLMPDEKQTLDTFLQLSGDAYQNHPGALRTDYQSFREVLMSLYSHSGKTVGTDKSPDPDLVNQAFNIVTGGVTSLDGSSKVFKPYGMPDTVFRARYDEAFRAAMTLNGMDPDMFPSSTHPPITMGNGSYALRDGVGYLLNREGNAILFNIRTGPDMPAYPAARLKQQAIPQARTDDIHKLVQRYGP